MFLTGPAGADKSTDVKAAEVFCQYFFEIPSVPWMDTTYLYTAYILSVAVHFGDITIYKQMESRVTKPNPCGQCVRQLDKCPNVNH